ncbi:CSS-motif domain-containing protein, partial [Klebsiella aerogenes]|nr:CSS-motif domain-containing protein [Klebsiella aerogenes]
MQNAQKVISTYRRKRILVCLAVAFLTLAVTLTIRFISQRSQNQQRIQTVTRNMVIAMDNILQPLAAKHATLLSMVGKPCQDVHLELRKTAATLQTVRSIILVQSGMAYCSSIFGPRHVAIHQLQPTLPAVNPLLAFSTDNSLLKGTPVLIQWYPSSVSGADGALLIINIELLGELILKEKSSLISDISLTVGNKSFLSDVGVVASDRLPGLPIIYRQSSSQFPFTINISG